jgi:hypothetical protein
MPSAAMSVGRLVLVNGAAFVKGCQDAQRLQVNYMRTELKRGAQRIRKNFIRTQLQGPPGITAGKLARGKNVWTFTGGSDAKSLHAKIGISRILHVHERGMTITPSHGPFLFIHGTGSKKDEIVAAVRQVVIPARLRFRQEVAAEGPAMLQKVGEAASRASEVALSRALQGTVRL